MTDGALFRIRGLVTRFGARPVVRGVDFDLHAGERVALLGPNGAGKSTFLAAMVGLVPAAEGTIEAFGKPRLRERDFAEVRARAGLVFQDPEDQLFSPTVIEDVAFGPLNLGQSEDEALATADKVLLALRIGHLAERVTHRLSGGEKRLVSLAAVLAMDPEVLLLDEPTNALDADARERLVALLDELPQAMVLVTHDETLVARLACRPMVMREGRLLAAEIHRHPHSHIHRHGHVHVAGAPHTHAEDHHVDSDGGGGPH